MKTMLVVAVGICAVVGGGCAGAASGAAQTSGQVAVQARLELPKVGNPKYDKFFTDVSELARVIAEARESLERAPRTLNKALGLPATTNLDTAMTRLSAKIFAKVRVKVGVTPTGVVVDITPIRGATLTEADNALIAAYKEVVSDLAQVPFKVEPVVKKSTGVVKQAVHLVLSAKSDFTGWNGIRTLPSVLRGLGKVKSAFGSIATDVPVIMKQSTRMLVTVKSAMGV